MAANGGADAKYGNKIKPIATSDSLEYDAASGAPSPPGSAPDERLVLRKWRTRCVLKAHCPP